MKCYGEAQLSAAVVRRERLVWVPADAGERHQCNAFCRGTVHATVMFSDYAGALSVEDIQVTVGAMDPEPHRPVRVLAAERVLEVPTPPDRPYAWMAWVTRDPAVEW